MNDDLKALRALVKCATADGACSVCLRRLTDLWGLTESGTLVGVHDDDCLVPAAEAALARLEAREVAESGRTRYDLGDARYAEAREQAARIAEDAKGEEPWYDLYDDECGEAEEIAARIRAMEPEG